MTATKAFIAFCLLAVIGTVLVIGPAELRRLLPGGTLPEVAVLGPETKPAAPAGAKAESRLEAKVESKPESKPEINAGSAPEAKAEARPEPKGEAPKLAAAPAVPSAPVADAAPKAGAVAESQKQVAAALADLAPVKPPASAPVAGPRFDVARIDERGEAAVIAGQAAPNAKVELLRDGKPLFAVTADAAGQFVMTPPQLPAGAYELTLRAQAPDGTVTQSSRTMPVTIAEAAPPPARLARQEAKPDAKPEPKLAAASEDRPEIVAALPSAKSAERAPSRPRAMGAAKPKPMARSPDAPTTVASASPAEAFTPASQPGARVIARGDSLWALSRLAYGDGARYAVIFNANRDKIHNPNLIYPGQTFVMPPRAE